LPSSELIEVCKKNKINIIEKCIYSYDGMIDIFTGRFDNKDLSDVSSVNNDWWGVDNNSKMKNVGCMTLPSFFSQNKIEKITYLKVDTEGSEFEIINQLELLKPDMFPEIVEFEYGGGCAKKENKNGWSQVYFNKTIECINLLKRLGYKYALIFERERNEPIELNLNENIELQFKDFYVYGDIIFFREKIFKYEDLINAANVNPQNKSFCHKIFSR
jgi:FkbM family methyltransferase